MSIKYGSLNTKEIVEAAKEKLEVEQAAAPAFAPIEEPKKTITNWDVFAQTGLKPTYMRCDTPQEYSAYNPGCHTLMIPTADAIASHLRNGHGGGVYLSFREGIQVDQFGASTVRTGRHWDGWKRFEELGLELLDFRCDICNAVIKVNSKSILKHLKPHTGKSSRMRPGGDFWLVVGTDIIDSDEDES